MNLRYKYYFCNDFYLNKDYSKEVSNCIKEFENKSNLKLTDEHKDFLKTFPAGAEIEYPFENIFTFGNDFILIDSIYGINISFFEDIYSDAKNLNLIPFVECSGTLVCAIGGGEENLGDVYFYDNIDDGGIENRVLICKGFDTFMSGYKKTEGYD